MGRNGREWGQIGDSRAGLLWGGEGGGQSGAAWGCEGTEGTKQEMPEGTRKGPALVTLLKPLWRGVCFQAPKEKRVHLPPPRILARGHVVRCDDWGAMRGEEELGSGFGSPSVGLCALQGTPKRELQAKFHLFLLVPERESSSQVRASACR